LVTWIWNGGPYTVPSAMSKAGIAAMSQSLAVEWGSYGIRFNNIAPGPFPTEGMSARLNPSQREESGGAYGDMSANPMGRVGEMRELANLAVYLLHPLSAYVNGQTIAIDGAAWQATGGNFARLRAWGDAEWQAARSAIQQTNEKDRAQRTV
ncbi:MAG: SDR family oxidoreductase, partial [Caulobacteraceae bacterium]|nr:SDR family oxidoreductase [Caulobacteraceae bacterium]